MIRQFLGGAIVLMLALTGCQTAQHREFERVRLGMDKTDVIQTAGNPKSSRRVKGQDRWTYFLASHPDGPQWREVHFENDKVVYVGHRQMPVVTAAEQDRINEAANLAEEKRIVDEQLAFEKRQGAVRMQPLEALAPNEQSREELELELQGVKTGKTLEREKSRRAPKFEPLD